MFFNLSYFWIPSFGSSLPGQHKYYLTTTLTDTYYANRMNIFDKIFQILNSLDKAKFKSN